MRAPRTRMIWFFGSRRAGRSVAQRLDQLEAEVSRLGLLLVGADDLHETTREPDGTPSRSAEADITDSDGVALPPPAPSAAAPLKTGRRRTDTTALESEIKRLIAEGLSRQGTAERTGISYARLCYLAQSRGIELPKDKGGMVPDAGRIEAVRALLAEGLTHRETATRLGLTRHAVSALVHRHRLGSGQRGDQDRAGIIRTMAAAGDQAAEIAAANGVTESNVYRLARKHGIALPRKRNARAAVDVPPDAALADAPTVEENPPEAESARARHPGEWPDERVVLLGQLVEQGFSATDIAAELGVTRNAVMGQCHRRGLRLRGTVPRRPRVFKPAETKPDKPVAPKVSLPVSRPAPRLKPAPVIPPVSQTPGKRWVRLQHPDGLRWLRMDGLDWVTDKAGSYLVQEAKLKAVREAFPLARECRLVIEPGWKPRDGQNVRDSW